MVEAARRRTRSGKRKKTIRPASDVVKLPAHAGVLGEEAFVVCGREGLCLLHAIADALGYQRAVLSHVLLVRPFHLVGGDVELALDEPVVERSFELGDRS